LPAAKSRVTLAFMVLYRAIPLVLMSSLVACGGANANAKVSAEASAEAEVDFDKEPSAGSVRVDPEASTPSPSEAVSAPAAAGPLNGAPALFGARHDVRLRDPGKSVVCQCLAAVRGSATLEGLTWSDVPPVLDVATQTLVVIESEGIACTDAKAPGASYMGYHKEGNDVVIDLEAAHSGRPVTRGAIIPLPGDGGHVRISAPKSLPYGKGLKDGEPCML
jgi:hypothetical protein